eukprot:gene4174-5224_t
MDSELDTTIVDQSGILDTSVSYEDDPDVWGQLISTNQSLTKNFQLKSDNCYFGRNANSDILFKDKRISSKHCRLYRKREPDEVDYRFYLEDFSTNGTFINKTKIGRGNTVTIVNGSEFSLTPSTEGDNSIVYIFRDLDKARREKAEEKRRQEQEENEQNQEGFTQIIDGDDGISNVVLVLDDNNKNNDNISLPPQQMEISPIKPASSKSNVIDSSKDETTSTPSKLVKQSTVQLSPSPSSSNIRGPSKSNLQHQSSTLQDNNKRKVSDEDESLNDTKDEIKLSVPKKQKLGEQEFTDSKSTPPPSIDNNNNNNNINNSQDLISTPTKSNLTSTTTTTTTTTTTSTNNTPNKTNSSAMEDNLICGICQEIIHKCLTLIPCMHNFCMCCYGDWREQSTICPQCRVEVKSAQKNHAINNLIDVFLSDHPDKKRDPADLEDMDKRCKITEDIAGVIVGGMVMGNHNKCHFCSVPMANGFQCPATGAQHNTCSACYKLFPKIVPPPVPVACELCSRPFCDNYQACTGHLRSKFGKLKDQVLDIIPPSSFGGNLYEIKIIQDYLTKSGKNANQVFHDILACLDDGRIQPASIQPNTGIIVKSENYSCLNCARWLFGTALFHYRPLIPKDDLPDSAKDRMDCYYGKNCRTQFSKFEHAKKFNHVCQQTKFS